MSFLVTACSPFGSLTVTDTPVWSPLVLTSANIVDVVEGRILPDRSVHIEGDRIIAIFEGRRGPLRGDGRVVDLAGAWVTPGLVDMHVHVDEAAAADLLDHGITTVRQMWGDDAGLAWKERVVAGALIPAMILASPGVDGPAGTIPGALVAANASELRALRPRLDQPVWDLIKVYQFVEKEPYRELVRLARQEGWRLAGHVPTSVSLAEALRDLRTIEHLEGYDRALTGMRKRGFAAWADADTAGMGELASMSAAAGVWNVPTLVTAARVAERNMDGVTAARVRARRLAMVQALHRAGAGILVGTDAGVPVAAPGASYHDEIAALREAGMSPTDVLRAATTEAARALGLEDEIGVVRTGARADLLILQRNPLDDPAVLRTPSAVVVRGIYRCRGVERLCPRPSTRHRRPKD